MPQTATYYSRILPGHDAFKGILDTALALFPNAGCVVTLGTSLTERHVAVDVNATKLLADNAIRAALDHLKSRPYVVCKSATVQSGRTTITYSTTDDIVAQVKVHVHDGAQPDEILKVTDEVAKHFKLGRKDEIIDASLPAHVQQNLRYQERALADLNNAVSQIGQYALDQTTRQSEYLDKKQADLDQRFQSRLDKLETEYQQRRSELASREDEHNKKVATFETRESKYVRRSLLDKMENKIQEQKEISLSLKTGRKRWVVHAICVIVLLVSAALAGSFAYHVLSSQSTEWRFFVPISVGTFVFIGTVIYYIRWNDQWFREHAQAEFRNMRFSADILRASWIAELLFEWEHEKKGEALPPEVVSSFTRSLFRDERIPGTEHPAETLGKALAQIAKVRLTHEGVEVSTRGRHSAIGRQT